MVKGSEVNQQWADYFNECTKEGRLTKDQVETVKRSCLNKGKCCFLMTRNSKLAGMIGQMTQFSNKSNAERILYGNSHEIKKITAMLAPAQSKLNAAKRN